MMIRRLIMTMYKNSMPVDDPEHRSQQNRTETAAEPQAGPVRRNPRLVIGNLDYFDMLMEMEEE